jgi:hypothetical protein
VTNGAPGVYFRPRHIPVTYRINGVSRENNNESGAAATGAPDSSLSFFLADQRSGERGFAVRDQHVCVGSLNREGFVLFLEPDELGFQVPYSLLEAAHLANHTRVWTADVAE